MKFDFEQANQILNLIPCPKGHEKKEVVLDNVGITFTNGSCCEEYVEAIKSVTATIIQGDITDLVARYFPKKE